VEAEAYFLACQCYVELTPVRAAVMSGPADYRWSSFAANSGAYRDAIRESTNSGFGLGSDRFQRQVAAMLGRRTW
jgi:putative transposase